MTSGNHFICFLVVIIHASCHVKLIKIALIYFYLVCFAEIEAIDIPRILSQQGGEAVYPLPRIKALEVHSKLNLAALLFSVKNTHLHHSCPSP